MIMIKPVYEVLLQVQTLKSITVWQHKIHIHHKPKKLYSFLHKPSSPFPLHCQEISNTTT